MTQKERIMKILQCSEEEALEILEQDKLIDQGFRTYFDLEEEDEKSAKKMINTPTHKRVDKIVRNRKKNTVKEELIEELFNFLEENQQILCENVEITNRERQLSFICAQNSYDLVLIQKRKPK